MSKCKWCGRENEGNAGDFYHEKDCHRRDVLRRMKEPNDPEAMAKLERELWQASYTGD